MGSPSFASGHATSVDGRLRLCLLHYSPHAPCRDPKVSIGLHGQLVAGDGKMDRVCSKARLMPGWSVWNLPIPLGLAWGSFVHLAFKRAGAGPQSIPVEKAVWSSLRTTWAITIPSSLHSLHHCTSHDLLACLLHWVPLISETQRKIQELAPTHPSAYRYNNSHSPPSTRPTKVSLCVSHSPTSRVIPQRSRLTLLCGQFHHRKHESLNKRISSLCSCRRGQQPTTYPNPSHHTARPIAPVPQTLAPSLVKCAACSTQKPPDPAFCSTRANTNLKYPGAA